MTSNFNRLWNKQYKYGQYSKCLILFWSLFFILTLSSWVEAKEVNGEQIYMQSCIVCHGDDGSGNMPGVPDLSDSKTLLTEKDLLLLNKIKSGIQTPGNLIMPPKGGNPNLSDEQLLRVIKYIQQLIKQ